MGGAEKFNQELKTWDTKAVKNMKNMFKGAVEFNKELKPDTPEWDLSAVTSMEGMFEGATKFNNDDKDTMKTWITSAVTNMASMFKCAADFNLRANSPNRIGAIRGGAPRFRPLKGTGSPLQNRGENALLLFLSFFFLFQQALF